MKNLRRYLVAGVLIWIPVVVTYVVFKFLVDLMDNTLKLLPEAYRPETILGFHIPGLGVLLTAAVLLLTGMLVANFFGRRLVDFWESLLARIPFVRTVYSSAKSFAETVVSDTSQSFKKVLLIEYPRTGIWSLCFQTSTKPAEIQSKTETDVVCVFVPTTPNPTSGFIMMVPRADVIELDMKVDQALKMIISLGVVVPEWRPKEPAPELAPAKTDV